MEEKKLELLFSEFFITKQDGRSTVRLFVSEPTPLEEENFGRVFALLEIEPASREHETMCDSLLETLTTHFYGSDAFQVNNAFENALQKTNQHIADLVQEYGEEWLHSAHMLIGVFHENTLMLAHTGRVAAFLVHRNTIIDIIDTATSKREQLQPQKIFAHTVNGEIPTEAIILVATERILDYVSREKIRRMIENKKPHQAAEEFNALLSENTTTTNFLGLIFRIIPRALQQHTPFATISSSHALPSDSMEKLVDKQRQTEEFLTPSVWSTIKKRMQTTSSHLQSSSQQKTEEHNRQRRTSFPSHQNFSLMSVVIHSLVKGIRYGGYIIGLILSGMIGFIQRIWISQRHPHMNDGSHQIRSQNRSSRLSSMFSRIIQWFQNLSVVQKLFVVIATIVLIIFAQSVVNRGDTSTNPTDRRAEEQILFDVEKQVNEAKAATIYDPSKARSDLREARTLLKSVDSNSRSYRTRGQTLMDEITKQLAIVNNVTTIDNPTMVLDFTTVHPQINVSHMVLLGASIYTFDRNNGSSYRGNLENHGTTVALNDTRNNVTVTAIAKASPGRAMGIRSDQSVVFFNPVAETYEPIDLGYGNNPHALQDIVVFGNRVYTLDTQNNQIWRHIRSADVFAEGTPWITDKTSSLNNSIAMAIDGAIYILHTDGTLTKYTNGNRVQNFALEITDPELSQASTVITDETMSSIYIVDAKNPRVILFDKNGKYTSQYQFPKLEVIHDIIVDESNYHLYILSNARVYEVTLPSTKNTQALSPSA